MKMRCKQVRDEESETKQDRRAGAYGIADTSRTNGVHKGKRSRPARHGDARVGPEFCPCRCAIRNPHYLVNETPRNGATPWLTPNARAETRGCFRFYREFPQGFSCMSFSAGRR